MRLYVTKWLLQSGIVVAEEDTGKYSSRRTYGDTVYVRVAFPSGGQDSLVLGKDVFETWDEAAADANLRVKKAITAAEKKLVRLRSMKF